MGGATGSAGLGVGGRHTWCSACTSSIAVGPEARGAELLTLTGGEVYVDAAAPARVVVA